MRADESPRASSMPHFFASRSRVLPGLCAALLCALSATVSLAQPAPMQRVDHSKNWRWRQVFSHPRTNGALSAIAVDPRDPKRIFVGSREGTLYRSTDRGVTWDEIDMKGIVKVARSLTLVAPGLPRLGAGTPSPLTIFFDAPFQKYLDRIFVTGVELVQFSTLPENIVVGFVPIGVGVPQSLLTLAERDRRPELTPISRIAVCPGAYYPIQVAGRWELFGSRDGGDTFVRLFGLPGVPLLHVVCNPSTPSEIYLATGFGLYRSSDGGLTFDQILVGWPGAPATAVTVVDGDNKGDPNLVYAAWGSGLWAGNPDAEEGLRILYPDFKNSDTAPWSDIRWLYVTPDRQIWMATDDGIRVSYDNGKNWVAEARSLLERQRIRQVEVGSDEEGRRRVAVLLKSWVYATDDDGKSWYPFFNGVSGRSFRQMAVSKDDNGNPSGWWVLTRGGLWTSVPPDKQQPNELLRREVRWANQRIAKTPPMQVVVDEVLDQTRLSAPVVNDLNDRARLKSWAPQLSLQYERNADTLVDLREAQEGDSAFTRNEDSIDIQHTYFAQLVWYFNSLLLSIINTSGQQNQMHGLRNQVRFIAQDAWYERMVLLRRIASGETNLEQTQALRARIESNEALLEGWMRRSLDSFNVRHQEG